MIDFNSIVTSSLLCNSTPIDPAKYYLRAEVTIVLNEADSCHSENSQQGNSVSKHEFPN